MPDRRSRSQRPVLVVAVLALVAVSVAATWIAADRIRSPAEVAARTLPPEAAPILVPVEELVLSTDVVTRGTGRFGSPQVLTTPPSNLKSALGFVDTVRTVGTMLDEGDVALVVSGRPVVVLRGAQPAYRDLGPGVRGDDVLQLEEALERLGFPPGEVDGVFDLATEVAVSEWYLALGYRPVMLTDEQRAQIRAIEDQVAAVERDVVSASDALTTARAELVAAREAHRVAVDAAAASGGAVDRARAQAAATEAVAAGEVSAADAEIARAIAALPPPWATAEEQRLALEELDRLRMAAETVRARAETDRLAAEAEILDAEHAQAAAPGEVASTSAAVVAAEARVAIAAQAVDLATAPVSRLERDLESAKERAGVQVPVDEIVFVADTPVRVAESHVVRGDAPDGPLLSVTDAVLAVDGTLALDQATLVEPGMAVEISEPDLGISTSGVVSAVADLPGARGADGFHVWFETVVDDVGSTNIVGASVRLTIPIESSEGLTLAVPASALTLAADGSSTLLIDRGGRLETVVVDPGLGADGWVAIASLEGEVDAGDLVVIGFEPASVEGVGGA